CMSNLAVSYTDLGRYADALKLREESLALSKAKLGPDHPATLASMNRLARLLATAGEVKFRDPPRAVVLAAEAAEKSPKSAAYRRTLGAARYRAGDWKVAVADLEQAVSLGKPDDATN